MSADIRLLAPKGADGRHAYVADVVFRRWLGFDLEFAPGRDDHWTVSVPGADARLTITSEVLAGGPGQWRPADSSAAWNVADELPEAGTIEDRLPVIAGSPDGASWFSRGPDGGARLGLDALGSAFWMLSREEELASSPRDSHDRFPGAASIAHRHGFLERPVIDEYVAVLMATMKRVWPGLPSGRGTGATWVTSDVDFPYSCDDRTAKRALRAVLGDLRRGQTRSALRHARNYPFARRGNFDRDPNNMVPWILTECRRVAHPAAFFFIADRAHRLDGCYDLAEPFVRQLLRAVIAEGHEIALHGSYRSFRDPVRIAAERRRLESECVPLGAPAPGGNRQHYLRWDASRTPRALADAGVRYDTSGCYADAPGFRFGTAHPFPMWSWDAMEPVSLVQRPLILMDATLLAQHYLGLTDPGAIADIGNRLARRARQFGGDFVFLWHTNNLHEEFQREAFRALLAA